MGTYRRGPLFVFLCVLALAGCRAPQVQPHPHGPVPNAAEPTALSGSAGDYTIVFPDLLQLDVPGQPDWSGHFLVPPDGRITFRDGGTLLLEGATVAQVRQRVAELSKTPVDRVTCHVSHARSRVVYLLGSVQGEARALPYTGPERVVDVLQRSGGLATDADRDAITITRRNVANGLQSETYRVDLAAIAKGDNRTNIWLEPNDEISVGKQEGPSLSRTLTDLLGR